MSNNPNDPFNNKIVLIDPFIHEKAKLKKEEFLSRVKDIKYLITENYTNFISFYVTNKEEHNNLIRFHNLVNKGIFDFPYNKVNDYPFL